MLVGVVYVCSPRGSLADSDPAGLGSWSVGWREGWHVIAFFRGIAWVFDLNRIWEEGYSGSFHRLGYPLHLDR